MWWRSRSHDPAEFELPKSGLVEVENPETGRARDRRSGRWRHAPPAARHGGRAATGDEAWDPAFRDRPDRASDRHLLCRRARGVLRRPGTGEASVSRRGLAFLAIGGFGALGLILISPEASSAQGAGSCRGCSLPGHGPRRPAVPDRRDGDDPAGCRGPAPGGVGDDRGPGAGRRGGDRPAQGADGNLPRLLSGGGLDGGGARRAADQGGGVRFGRGLRAGRDPRPGSTAAGGDGASRRHRGTRAPTGAPPT